jgi:hypothetical protein
MIYSRDIASDAAIKTSQLQGHGFGLAAIRTFFNVNEVRYVDSNGDGAADQPSAGKHPDKGAFLTVAYAVTQVPANTVLVVRELHTETIVAADAWLWAQAGVKVVGCGTGTERPTFTFTTAAAATILLDKANTVLMNLRFINGIASQTTMIDMMAAGCQIIGCHFQVGDATTQAATAVRFSTGGDDCSVLGNRFVTTIVVAVDSAEIAYNKIYGDFELACIYNPTATAATLLDIHHNRLTNLQAGDHAIWLVSACTGTIENNIANSTLAAAGTVGAIDGGSCFMNENYGVDATADVSGLLNPVADA